MLGIRLVLPDGVPQKFTVQSRRCLTYLRTALDPVVSFTSPVPSLTRSALSRPTRWRMPCRVAPHPAQRRGTLRGGALRAVWSRYGPLSCTLLLRCRRVRGQSCRDYSTSGGGVHPPIVSRTQSGERMVSTCGLASRWRPLGGVAKRGPCISIRLISASTVLPPQVDPLWSVGDSDIASRANARALQPLTSREVYTGMRFAAWCILRGVRSPLAAEVCRVAPHHWWRRGSLRGRPTQTGWRCPLRS